ncbi:DUS16 phosphatase, partial [Columbina picui]|nr:DUS16 phosphatase [Columbina picui]
MADEMIRTQLIVAEKLVALLESGTEKLLLIDSRPFVEYNTSHVLDAININCSKLMKRRLQQDKVLITELIQHSAKHKIEIDCKQEVVVYDQSSKDVTSLSSDCFLTVLLGKLEKNFSSVYLLSGGFAEFSSSFPGLCEGKSTLVPTCISQPCLPVSNIGPTRILPHLYLGCQRDVLNKELMQQNDIGYVLNASNTCPKPDFIPESHFLRVPVNDSFCEKILPWLDRSVDFIEKAKASNGCVLVHCLAGISRSATIAIAYIMKRMDMSLDEAYRFVKEKRPTISPNFNFLGQLLDFEKKIKNQSGPPGHISKLKLLHLEKSSEHVLVPEGGQSSLSTGQLCITTTSETAEQKPTDCGSAPRGHLSPLEDGPLVQGINGLHVSLDKVEDSNRLKRSFSLDIKSVSYSASSTCQHLAKSAAGLGLKGWHSDILAPQTSATSLTNSWYFAAESSRFYSASAVYGSGAAYSAYSCSQLPTGCDPACAVRRRHKQGDRGDSRRSWHEESSFEKQFKRRSCQMEFGESIMSDNRSREELGKVGSQSSFSGSMEIIEVS